MNKSFSIETINSINAHIQVHKLPEDFLDIVEEFYKPIIDDIVTQLNEPSFAAKQHPYFLGIQGSQGSGKSTFASFIKLILESEFQLNCAVLSIDDFYLTKQERQDLSQEIHPLFATRGVPGTHDTELLKQTLTELKDIKAEESKQLVTFDKANDDRFDQSQWQEIVGPQDVVILEGWCVGISSQSTQELATPINELEKKEDESATWRGYVNQQIALNYQPIYGQLTGLAVLAAPSFDCVYHWRLKQEQKLIEKLKSSGTASSSLMSPNQIKRFISHYQRLTEHGLNVLPDKANWLLQLQENHSIAKLIKKCQ